ncbi:MAG: EF-hand domain-containing protein [Geminicoccaceae bacterium]|nr:EF-hand domain-containing protein [Geminicoccaceae bacterium]MCS7267920.1 EF-hand domain-containing protein [Geminicoccaceae bacterium]MCX7631406.1 EF-hand domain-containing protein [Geminicoccaceae bacterium]MDW8124450.1 EF-hand domain-containing protein [Geminicoccaceae bacterium]MDW8342481.1 EF-hand domain-containing protein [Geminicoccaceae bacterium]
MSHWFRILALPAALLAFAAGGAVQAQPRGPLGWADANRDGVVTREEFEQLRARRFDRLDTNKDGTISREEFMAREAALFERLDRDKDGRITPEEMHRRGRR